MGQLGQLTTLSLDHNELSALPDALQRCTSLTELNCRHNALQQLPLGIGALVRLQSLDAGSNRLHSLPQSMTELTSLIGCDLSYDGRPHSAISGMMAEVPSWLFCRTTDDQPAEQAAAKGRGSGPTPLTRGELQEVGADDATAARSVVCKHVSASGPRRGSPFGRTNIPFH